MNQLDIFNRINVTIFEEKIDLREYQEKFFFIRTVCEAIPEATKKQVISAVEKCNAQLRFPVKRLRYLMTFSNYLSLELKQNKLRNRLGSVTDSTKSD